MIPRCRCAWRQARSSRCNIGLQNSDRLGTTRASTTSSFQNRHRQRLRTTPDAIDELINSDVPPVPATRTLPSRPPPDELPKTEQEEKISKARVVFGSRLAGPKERRRELDKASIRIAGILVPPRPEEPDNCCMSGCVNCVWDRYRDELEEWASKSAEARQALTEQRAREQSQRSRKADALGRTAGESSMPRNVAGSMDDDGGGSEALWQSGVSMSGNEGDLFADIPVGIREFMKQEKRLKEKKQKRKQELAASD